VRAVIGIILALAILAWTASMIPWGVSRAQWQRLASASLEEQLAFASRGDLPQSARLRLASAYSREVFPPRHDLAIPFLRDALLDAPGDATTWNAYARTSLLLGEREWATSALRRADLLDPRYPRQRIESIRLWHLLGEEPRALEVAEQVASLGLASRTAAARELMELRYPPARVFAILDAATLPPGDLLGFCWAIRTRSPELNRAGYDLIPPTALKDDAFRDGLAELCLNPVEPHTLARLWRLEAGVDVTPDGPVRLSNPDLGLPPFGGGFPLGWLRLEKPREREVSWLAPGRGAAPSRGTIEIRWVGEEGEAYFPFYRLLIPPGTGRTIALRVRVEDPEAIDVRLDARVLNGPRNAGEVTRAGTPEVQEIVARIPDTTEFTAGDLAIRLRRKGAASRGTRVFLHGLELREDSAP
jgi:hypothetical protein